MTPASWIRRFVREHPAYAEDSAVSPAIAHDLLVAINEIGTGARPCPELLGDISIDRCVECSLGSEGGDLSLRLYLL
jgi:glutamate--cysteine ligase catalytic subunit